jgi:methylmalonyl-CoA mutase cobalamin-binding subunit
MSADNPVEIMIWTRFPKFFSWRKNHPWYYLWVVRFLEYGIVFFLVEFIGNWLYPYFGCVPTLGQNALYFLSSMVQVQAAIIALVVSLTLVAIQMASSSYTPRVIDVMKKNPDMWILLFIYITAISYEFVTLKVVSSVEDPNLVFSVLILGIFTFLILFLYLWNTIALLRPDKIVSMLVDEINVVNIKNEMEEEILMQPVFDVVHASISRFDVTTTRAGLEELSERLLKHFSSLSFDDSNNQKNVEASTRCFCNHIERSSLIALKNDDEGILHELINVLNKFGTSVLTNEQLVKTSRVVIKALKEVGIQAANRGLNRTTTDVVKSLKEVAIHSVKSNRDDEVPDEVRILKCFTKISQFNRWGSTENVDTVTEVVRALKEVGIHAVDKGSLSATNEVIEALEQIGILTTDREFSGTTTEIIKILVEIGIHAVDKGHIDVIDKVTLTLTQICRPVLYEVVVLLPDNTGMSIPNLSSRQREVDWVIPKGASALEEVGNYAIEKGLVDAIPGVAYALEEIGIFAANRGLNSTIIQVAWSLSMIGTVAHDKKLFRAVDPVVEALCTLGCNKVAQDVAAKDLALIIFQDKKRISKLIDDFKTDLDALAIPQFDLFLEKIKDELNKRYNT